MLITRKKFTLLELFIVIAILVILVAILLPALFRAKEKTRQVLCVSNLRQLGVAFIVSSKDSDSHLPGNSGQDTRRDGPERWQKTWMGKECDYPRYKGPKTYYGTITDYTGGPQAALGLYRCPSLKEGPFRTNASNGRFDYVSVQSWTGMKLSNAPELVEYNSTIDGNEWISAFILIEEDPRRTPNQPNNGLNAGDISPGFAGGDRLGTWHEKTKSFYITFDGSYKTTRNLNQTGPGAKQIKAYTPNGAKYNLGRNENWGWWNGQ